MAKEISNSVMNRNVAAKLTRGLDLTKSQVEYVKANIEPNYENDCGVCRLNVLLYLGYAFDEAYRMVDNSENVA